jgi:hypothetical protein
VKLLDKRKKKKKKEKISYLEVLFCHFLAAICMQIWLMKTQIFHHAKISSFKNPHIKIDLSIHMGKKSLKLLYSIMNLNTISLPLGRQGQ